MNERTLKPQAPSTGATSASEAYRFLWLRTFDHPVLVRAYRTGERLRIDLKELDGKGGYEPGKLLVEKSRELTRRQWSELTRRINESSFWTMDTTEEQSYVDENGQTWRWALTDGSRWILEGVRGKSYHIVDRQSPHFETERRKLDKYRATCVYMLGVAGFDLTTNEVY